MENTKKQLSGWHVLWWSLGLSLISLSTLLKQNIMLYLGSGLTLSFFFYRMYQDWKTGDSRAVRRHLLWLAIAILAGCIAYVYCARKA